MTRPPCRMCNGTCKYPMRVKKGCVPPRCGYCTGTGENIRPTAERYRRKTQHRLRDRAGQEMQDGE